MAKDRYGIVRGGIVFAILLVLCVVLIVEMVMALGRASIEARAEDTASRVVAQFEQMVRSAFDDLYGAASVVREDPSREDVFLEALYEYSPYTEVGVLSDNTLRHRDGSSKSIEYVNAYIYAVNGVPRGRILALTDGSLLLCATIEEDRELAARYDPTAMDRILGSSFKEDYEFAVYNAATGSYMVNHTSFASGGYYDALLSLNEGGSTAVLLRDENAIALLPHLDGGVYIAQQRTDIRPWNISLIIPRAVVGEYIWNKNKMLYALTGVALLLLAVYVFVAILATRRARRERRTAANELSDSERMLENMAREAQVTLFNYHRGQEDLMDCFDGLGLLGRDGAGRTRISLSELEEACGINVGDVERLHERLSGLVRGESAELTLQAALPDREERMLRFKLDANVQDEDIVICSVQDGTQHTLSQSRAEIEQNYLESTVQRTVAVWVINVSRNLWRNLYMKDPETMGPLGPLQGSDWRDFTADLCGLLRDFIYPVDYADHVQQMSIPVIAEAYRFGRTEFDTDYRVCSTGVKDYIWHRMHVRIYSDPNTGDILAHVFVFNVDVEKNAELERGERKSVFKKTMRALSGIYYALYYVDLDNDICYAAKSYDGELVTELSAPYRETFDHYLEGVHPEDREALRAMLDAFSIRRSFSENSRFLRMEYRRRSGDEYRWAAAIIQPARFENGRVKEVAIAMRHLTSDRHELDLE